MIAMRCSSTSAGALRSFARAFAIAVGLGTSLFARSARATYSIVASDVRERQSGGAGTSCLGGGDVYIIFGSVPGVGAVHAQALFSQAGRERAVALLGQGQSPAQIILALTQPGFDARARSRQYAVVDVTGQSAGFTGDSAQSFAADLQGAIGDYSYSVQGNILTGDAVLSEAALAFEAGGCDLADRLMSALEAGARGGQGDSRCTESRGIPSDSAFLQVDVPGEPSGSFLSLRVPSSGSDNPLVELRALFDQWRQQNPCSRSLSDAGLSGVVDAGSEPTPDGGLEPRAAGDFGAGNVSSAGDRGGRVNTPIPVDAGSASGASAGVGVGGGSGGVTAPPPGDLARSGCACRATGSSTRERWFATSAGLTAAVMALGARRRRQPRVRARAN